MATRKSLAIPGVPMGLCQHFSQRRREILSYRAPKGDCSMAAAQDACLRTRKPKKNVPPPDTLLRRWQEIATECGFSTEHPLILPP